VAASSVFLVNDGHCPLSASWVEAERREPGAAVPSLARSGWPAALVESSLSDAGARRADHGVNTDSDKLIGWASAGHAPVGLAPVPVAGSPDPDGLLAVTVGPDEGRRADEGTRAGGSGWAESSDGKVPDGLSERGESPGVSSPPLTSA
jgi:hypothetical protein